MDDHAQRFLFIAGKFDRGYSFRILRGMSGAASRRGDSVIAFALSDGIQTFDWMRWRSLFSADVISGAAVLATGVGAVLGAENVERVMASLAPVPVVSISRKMAAVPSVLSDSEIGVAAAVDHFVSVHGAKRIAFIKGPAGNDEALRRLSGYQEGLRRNGLPYDASLVADGDFTVPAGRKAAQLLWHARKGGFDAVIAANDNAALGVIDLLREKRLNPGRDYGIIGFDDSEDGRYNSVPLTSVRMQILELGEAAGAMLYAGIDGKAAADRILPTELIVRKSCGCFCSPVSAHTAQRFDDHAAWKKAVLYRMLSSLGRSSLTETAIFAGLDGAVSALAGGLPTAEEEKVFLEAMHALLTAEIRSGGDVTVWFAALAVLGESITESVFNEKSMRTLERVIALVHGFVGEKLLAYQVSTGLLVRNDLGALRWTIRNLHAASSLADIAAVFSGGLTSLGITWGILARFETPADGGGCAENASVFASWGSANAIDEGYIPLKNIIALAGDAGMLVLPLGVAGTIYGCALLGVSYRESITYVMLTDSIAATLKRLFG